MYTLLKTLLLPPFLLFGPFLAAWMLRRRRGGQVLFILGMVLAWGLSTPFIGSRLLAALETAPPLTRALPQNAAIVVLSAGIERNAPEYGGETIDERTLLRLRYGIRLQHKSGLPLLVSGGRLRHARTSLAALMRRAALEDFGLADVWTEEASLNTWENARLSAALLKEKGIDTAVLVTHAWHMPRAAAAFRAQGVRVLAAPTGFTDRAPVEWQAFLPMMNGLNDSFFALHEFLGRLYYRIRYGAAL